MPGLSEFVTTLVKLREDQRQLGLDALAWLDETDPHLGAQLRETFNDEDLLVASWLTEIILGKGLSPLELLVRGERDTVLWMLGNINSGFCA